MQPFTPEARAKSLATRRAKAEEKRTREQEQAEALAKAAELREIQAVIRDAGIDAVLADDRLVRHPDIIKQMLGYATTQMLAAVVTGQIAPTSVKEAAAAAQAFHAMLKIEQGARSGLAAGQMGPADPIAQADRKAALQSFAEQAKARLNGTVTPITEAPSAQAQ